MRNVELVRNGHKTMAIINKIIVEADIKRDTDHVYSARLVHPTPDGARLSNHNPLRRESLNSLKSAGSLCSAW